MVASPPYSVSALAAAAVAGACGATALAIRSGVGDVLDPGTVHVIALLVCPAALAVVARAVLRYGRSRPEGFVVWLVGIVLLAAPGAWFVLSFSWWLVRVSFHTS